MVAQITWIAIVSCFGLANSAAISSTKVSRPYASSYEYNIDHSNDHWNGKVINNHGIRILDGAHYGGLYGHGVATSSSNFNLKPYGSAYSYGHDHDLSSIHDYNHIGHEISYANIDLNDHDHDHYLIGLDDTDGYYENHDDDDHYDHYGLLSGYGYGSGYEYHK